MRPFVVKMGSLIRKRREIFPGKMRLPGKHSVPIGVTQKTPPRGLERPKHAVVDVLLVSK